MTYARARLWLGITGVGTFTTLAALLLLFRVPARTLPTAPQGLGADLGALLVAVLLYAALHAPFDWFGGWILPSEYGRARERRRGATLVGFLLRWFRGAALHGALLLGFAALLMYGARWGGFWLALTIFVAISALLVALQGPLAGAIGSFGRAAPPPGLAERLEPVTGRPLELQRAGVSYFTGGFTGLPGRERAAIPERWSERLSEGELHAQVLRRGAVVASGARTRGVLLAVGFNGLGFALAYAVAVGSGPVGVAQIVSLALLSTLWSFLGVLLLPSASRPAVYMADAAALDAGADAASLAASIRKLDADQDDEPARSPLVEAIFHPIPSVDGRLQRIERPREKRPFAGRIAAWHAARVALYLSWAGLGLLGRAVHCNSGRPEVWVLLPSD